MGSIAKFFRSTIAVGALMLAGLTHATPVAYQGGQFDVTITGFNAGTHTYSFQYTADFANWTGGATNHILAVSFGWPSIDVNSVSLTGTNADGVWSAVFGTINSSGCSQPSNPQGPCGYQASGGPTNPTNVSGSPRYWNFDVVFDEIIHQPGGGTSKNIIDLTAAQLAASGIIRATFDSGNLSMQTTYNNCIGLTNCEPPQPCTSAECTDVPAPGSIALIGAGIIGLAGALRRRRRS